jgi:predicted chitinase
MKKIYILALTFFAVLCGQVSYGQDFGGGEFTGMSFAIRLPVASVGQLSSYGIVPYNSSNSFSASSNIQFYVVSMFQGSGTTYSSTYNNSNYYDNWCALYGLGCPETFNYNNGGTGNTVDYYFAYYGGSGSDAFTVSSWILDLDGDNYYSDVQLSVDSPGAGWRQAYGSGFDCDDNNPNIRRDCYQTYYIDDDQDGYHQYDIYNIDDNGGYYKTSTFGNDCDDYDSRITTQCYNDYYQDKDGDGYHSATQKLYYTPAYHLGWKLGTSLGADCDDNPTTGANVHKLNKCSKCEAEPVNGACGGDDCDTTVEDLKKSFPNASNETLGKLSILINTYAKQFGIDTKEELQHFLTQAGHETGGFGTLSVTESLNYSATRLVKVWPSRFSLTDAKKLNPNNYAHNSVKLGDYVYGGRNGNNNPGDGYLYRGRGGIQITGKTNYSKFSEFYKNNFDSTSDIVNHPGLIGTDYKIAVISALWFFQENVIGKIIIDENTSVNRITNNINPYEEEDIKKIRSKLFKDKIKPNIKCN